MSAVLPSEPSALSNNESLIDLLKNEPIISKASYESLSRLLPHVARNSLKAGEGLYRAGERARALYYVASGEMKLTAGGDNTVGKMPSNTEVARISKGWIGEEAVLGSQGYMADAVAATDVQLLDFPREHFNALIAANPGIRPEYFVSLMSRFSRENLRAAPPKPPRADEEIGWSHVAGWLLAILLPLIVYYSISPTVLDTPARLFMGIFTATVVMWVFRLTADFIPGIFAVMATLVFGLVPHQVVLSGFASDGFFMALSILGLSAVITSSGLSYRMMLWILRTLPNTRYWNNLGIMLAGIFLSPVVPSINGRVAMVTPLLIDMVEALRYEPKGRAASRLAMSAFTGVGILSAVFLTSKSVNFVIWGLLPAHAQEEFSWFRWMMAGLVAGLVMLVLTLATLPLFFRTAEMPNVSKDLVRAQSNLLGPMRAREWASIFGVFAFMLGVATAGLHKIEPPWMALLLLFFLLTFNYLRGSEFKNNIDWPFLMYLAGLVGMVNAMNHLGLTAYMGSYLGWLGEPMRYNFPLFVLILTCLMFAVRLVAPNNAVIAVSATVLMPLADLNGVNPWVVGFIILTMSEHWFFPYQCSYYIQFESIAGKRHLYDERRFLTYNAFSTLIRLAGIYASIPYWKSLGLL